MDFVAIDFETANEQRSSACEISLIKVSGGEVVGKFTSLIKPHSSMTFNPFNISIHGIRSADVKNAPEFSEVVHEILDFSSGLPLVAHNASFDMGVLRKTSLLYGLDLPDIDFYCTRILAKTAPGLDLPSYSLVNVCDLLGIPFLETHRAEADAEACAGIAMSLSREHGAAQLSDLAGALGVRPGLVSSASYSGSRSPIATRFPSTFTKAGARDYLASLSDDELMIDDDFVGKEVVFTGTLSSMDRKQAQEKVLRAGGSINNGVTKKTSIVVVGQPYDSEMKPGGTLSNKVKKVVDLKNKGVPMEVLNELEFLELFEN